MAKFKKKNNKGVPAISTASLPDVIFMLLFFFMISTVMRDTSLKVDQKIPEASEVQKLERKNLVSYIYVGKPKREFAAQFGTEDALQLNDSFESVDKIKDFVYAEKESRRPEERDALTFSIKGDVESKMGIVNDVKQELRKANALKINYSARQPGKKK
ncbi:MAG: biopolymer transporter ExbD [Flavobacteriales bacterium]|nr:biopolymer transporter ExbD [Flavobacteriales bacterium]